MCIGQHTSRNVAEVAVVPADSWVSRAGTVLAVLAVLRSGGAGPLAILELPLEGGDLSRELGYQFGELSELSVVLGRN